MPLGDEFEIIKVIKKTLGKPSKNVLLGIGDDAAVLAPARGKMVVTVDSMVEGVHFDLHYTTAAELGHKALAVSLSDCAAMGARPMYALVSLGLKQELGQHFITSLYEGMKRLAKQHKVDIVGGNIVQSPTALIVDVTVIGETKKKALTRGGARPGDIIAVTGDLGGSAAGLNCLRRLGRDKLGTRPEIVARHLRPTPRIKEADALVGLGAATSAIDISDGLSSDIHHLAEQSRVGMGVEQAQLPISKTTIAAAELIQSSANVWALYGGEDYELLLTITPKKFKAAQAALRRLKTPLTAIGEVLPAEEGVKLKTLNGEWADLQPRGWNHFVRRRQGP
jgi:thiamine-monophosphate kinase